MTPRDKRDCDCPDCSGAMLRFLEWQQRWRGTWITAFLLCALGAVIMAASSIWGREQP